jgi:hypothetical protein
VGADLTPTELDNTTTDEAVPDDTGANPLAGLSDEERAALHAQWDAEINTVIFVAPHEVLVAANVRTENAEADPATTANLKNHGVNTATNGYRRARREHQRGTGRPSGCTGGVADSGRAGRAHGGRDLRDDRLARRHGAALSGSEPGKLALPGLAA